MSGWLICGVDDSPEALAAAKVAAELAERMGADLLLAHVAPPFSIPEVRGLPHAQLELRELEKTENRRLLERVAREAGCPDAERRAETGDPARRLIELADEHEAEMLVVGSGGRGPVRALILGSVSLRLCREAHCPVLVVSPHAATAVIEDSAFAREPALG